MRTLYFDLETFSKTPITHGTHAYAANAEILLAAWAWDDAPVQVTDLTMPHVLPWHVVAGFNDPDVEVVIHNSHFDRTVLRHAWGINIPTERIHDTMVQAMAHSLPGSLGMLCEVLGLPSDKAKDKDGKRLIQLFTKPLGKNRKLDRATRETHPEEWERFKAYAASDIEAMREVKKRMPMVNFTPAERELWQLDQRINDRGVAIDLTLVDAAITAIDRAKRDLAGRTVELTAGDVSSTTLNEVFRLHVFEAFGVDLPDLQMATIEKTLALPDLNPALRELLLIRLQASSTSTAKYRVLMRGTSADSRLRGLLQFCGALRTGRWAGRLFQPQNLPRPTLKQKAIDAGIEALRAGCAHLTTDNVMELVSSAIRSCIVAPPGGKLVVADLSNIEGRVQSWLANEEWKLKAFRDFDAGIGPDLYKLAYSKSFGVAPDKVTGDQRQVGKVQELALGYEGGVGAFATFAGAYGIDLDDLAEKVLLDAPDNVVALADRFLGWTKKDKRPRYGLSEDAFVACDVLKRMWRDAHPNISGYWAALKDLVIKAMVNRGNTFNELGLSVRASKNWLLLGLPSGRALCYPSPKIEDGDKITYMGIDQYTRKWTRIHTHGGKLFENLCQAVARDIMAANMPLIEAAGYRIVLTVHDEIIAEAPDEPQYNAEHMASLLAANPSWAPDIPLAAAGFETYRYRKG